MEILQVREIKRVKIFGRKKKKTSTQTKNKENLLQVNNLNKNSLKFNKTCGLKRKKRIIK